MENVEKRRIIELGKGGREAIMVAMERALSRGDIHNADVLVDLLQEVIIGQVELILESFLGHEGRFNAAPAVYDTIVDAVGALDGDDIQFYVKHIAALIRKDDTCPVARIVRETSINLSDDGVEELWNLDCDVLLTETLYGLCPSNTILNDIAHTIAGEIQNDLPSDAEIYGVRIFERKINITYGYSD